MPASNENQILFESEFNPLLDAVTITIGNLPITNFTSYNIEFDFFRSSDAFSLVIEDSDATRLIPYLKLGSKVKIQMSNISVPQMIGYIDDVNVTYDRHSGTKVTITGRDILGQAAQAHILPNLGSNSSTNFQFTQNTTYVDAFERIFDAFGPTSGLPLVFNFDTSIQLKSGGKLGPSGKAKTVRGQVRSLNSQLSHLLKPEPSETYLMYASRLAECIGCYIKVGIDLNGNENIIISPPTYAVERGMAVDTFSIYHTKDGKLNPLTNVITANYGFSIKEQPSVIIGESTMGAPGYRKVTKKDVCINELTGYQQPATPNPLDYSNLLTNATDLVGIALPSVQKAVSDLTTTKGYQVMPSNNGILASIGSLPIQINTPFSRPWYYESYNAHEGQELEMEIRLRMAEAQNKFLTCNYLVQGHTQFTCPWQINTLCFVYDDIIYPSAPINTNLWIEKVNFTRTRSGGPMTNVKLNLPNTNCAEVDI